MTIYDVCIIGSGAGAGPVAAVLAEAGQRVLVLEKGPWYEQQQFLKDEVVASRRPTFWPDPRDEPQVELTHNAAVAGAGIPTVAFWNGSLVGGSSVLMSGFFMRLKPDDFRQRSLYGAVPGANVVDWPLAYDELVPWYDAVEREVGVSGRVVPLPPALTDRRTPQQAAPPMAPTREHPFASRVDETCERLGLHSIPLPRAVLSADRGARKACDYNGYCGSYGCTIGAKGSALAAWLPRALASGRCEIRPRAMVHRLVTDDTGRQVVAAEYFDLEGRVQSVRARVFVVACQAIESARLLLNSRSARHPWGLANGSGQVGRNLLFSGFGAGWGDFRYDEGANSLLRSDEPFVNRMLQDWWFYDPERPLERNAGRGLPTPMPGAWKGGTLNFLLMHPNPSSNAENLAFYDRLPAESMAPGDPPLWGERLKDRLAWYFLAVQHLKFEVFSEWLPHDNSRVEIDPMLRDRWGIPVSRIRAFNHPQGLRNVRFLVERGVEILRQMGARNPRAVRSYGGPSTNLMAGTCRFGDDPRQSVLDRNCKAHELDNLYVTDGSFMPSGGSVPYTFTIYANSLRVATHLAARMRGG